MAYVQLDTNGNVVGLFANPQPQLPGYAIIVEDDPRIAAFKASLAAIFAQGATGATNS